MIPSYRTLVERVRTNGQEVQTRFGPSRELLAEQVSFRAGEMIRRHGINRRLGWVELLQLIHGSFDPGVLRWAAPRADHSLFTEQMAYGPRIAPQVPTLLRSLFFDPNTRQAVIFVAHPRDGMTQSQTCTTTLQFLVRQGSNGTLVVHLNVTMRSWDLVKGISYDMVMFGGLLLAVALCLDGALPQPVVAGRVTVTAGSAHLYKSDMTKGRLPLDGEFGQEFFSLDGLRRTVSVIPEVVGRWFYLQWWAERRLEDTYNPEITLGRWVPEGIEVYTEGDEKK